MDRKSCCDHFVVHAVFLRLTTGMKFCPYCGQGFSPEFSAQLADPKHCQYNHPVAGIPGWKEGDPRKYYLNGYCTRCGDPFAVVIE